MNSFTRSLLVLAVAVTLSAVSHAQGCSQMQKVTVATIPSATSFPSCTVQVVDGITGSDCTVGGGNFNSICNAHGGAWVPIPVWLSGGQIFSIAPYSQPTIISPIIGLDPNFSTDSIYAQAGGTSLPIIAYSTVGNRLNFNTLGSGGSINFFVGNANFASYRFARTSLTLGELNGGVGNFAIDFSPSSSGTAAPVPSGIRWHIGTSGALSGSFFQDITANSWHFNSADVGASTTTDLVTITQAGTLGTKPVTFATLPACAAGTEGQRGSVTDSTTATSGATITGGGSNHVPAFCNGSVWSVN